jgi:hypothetical protein
MPKDAPPNGDAPTEEDPAANVSVGPRRRVSEMQAKLHRWAAADPGRRFDDDLFNLVHDPATLIVAWDRVAANRGANTAGSDGWTVTRIEQTVGRSAFLDDLRSSIKSGEFWPEPVRERKIPKPGGSGKVRRLGIPTVTDRVVQAALKLVLEPIFEADFESVSYGFRPERRAHDAIAEIHHFGTQGYRWVLDADIEACFDSIDHVALMDRVRSRVKNSPNPVVALAVALIAFHALTGKQIRELRLTDIVDGRLRIGNRDLPLAAPVRTRLAAWLDHRNRTWPESANPYLLINRRTAPRVVAVGRSFPWKGITLRPQSPREDRILHEIHASGGDIRRICDLFGLSITGATRYLKTVEHRDLAVESERGLRT